MAPRRTISMALPLMVAVGGMIAGAATANLGLGAIWGLIAAVALVLALQMGKAAIDNVDRMVLVAGLVATTLLVVRVLPGAPEKIDVLSCLRFGATCAPAAIACAVVALRRGIRPSSVVNIGLAWLLAGGFALPAVRTLGIMTPLSELRRGVDSVFGLGDYMGIGLILASVGIAASLAVMTSLPNLATVATLLIFTVFAGVSVGFTVPGLIAEITDIVNVPNFWPPDFAWAIGDGTWWWLPSWEFGAPLRENPMVETIRIAVIATVFGCVIALPLAFWASTLTALNKSTYLIAKGFMNLVRTIPDLFWAVIFVAALGGGPFAGTVALVIFSLAIMSKLLSETIDAAEPGPLEAAKATGARHLPALRSSVLPQVLPNYVAYALYVFELNIRASAVIGLVGAGGIGRVLEAQRVFFQFDRVLAIVIVIGIVVFILEQISVALRRRLV
ncbi:MAG: phosphonate ABC transporter, permease protein PhnE [Acidimicrobiia bacterium]